ncbi:MAG: hypothetical protein CO189_12460 [candidate division Zixibacteria bacterium CG_4_9_14_3_um_filter_46_8]|nr:MAG: hypothetical protein CO189_12460 [candidate division Zixibacteria bacterium CG_4_9_14_3_um_filter_46_8]
MAIRLVGKIFVDGFMVMMQPIANILISWRVHPHIVTIAGFLLSILSGYGFYRGNFILAGVLLIIAGICDVMDGQLARSTNRVSKYGALFDSSIDRYSEVFVYMGLVAFYIDPLIDALLILTIGGSFMTSYVRARAEGLGIECKVGIMQRPERLTYLSAGAIFSHFWSGVMIIAIIIVALFSNITAIQRIIYTYNNSK